MIKVRAKAAGLRSPGLPVQAKAVDPQHVKTNPYFIKGL
jgi:hypothetical protein